MSYYYKSCKNIPIFLVSIFIAQNITLCALGNASKTTGLSLEHRLKNWGLTNLEKSHIQALDAWKIQEGDRNIIVAVIDTGIDPNHKALSNNLWHSDSLENRFIYGWNFVSNQPNPTDNHGHGTHIAGIIGAIADPVTGISGVVHRVSIMPVKYYSEDNPGALNLSNSIKAIEYAIAHGARIINYSGGGPEFSQDEYLAIKKAETQGILFVAAAGNEHKNTDITENFYYPSAYHLSNMISVAATDIHNNLLDSSNWGKKNVDIAAPGENIFSTLPDGHFGYMSGTSQATAFVTGVATLLLSQNPTLTPQKVKSIILSSVDRFNQLQNKIATGGRLNAYKALMTLQLATKD